MVEASILARIVDRLEREAADAGLLRGSFLKQRLCALLGRRECAVRIAGVGRVTLRPRTMDMTSFRRVFSDGDYRIPVTARLCARIRPWQAGHRFNVLASRPSASSMEMRTHSPRALTSASVLFSVAIR